MNILLFCISVLLPTLAGSVLVCEEKTFSFMEKLVFSFSLGTGLLSFYLFGLVLMDVSFSTLHVLPFFIPFLLLGLWKAKELATTARGPWPSRIHLAGVSAGRKALVSVLAAVMAWKLVFIIFMISAGPTVFNDAFTCWNYKAKMIYYDAGGVLQGPFNNYPLHLPIMKAWIAFVLGGWDETAVNLHSVVLYLCLLLLTFAFLKKKLGGVRAMACTCVLATMPILVYNVISGYADMAVGYFFLASAVMLFYWNETRKARFLVFAGILLSTAMFTKNEGSAMVFPALFLTFLIHLPFTSSSWKQAATGMALFFISSALIVFWLARTQALNTFLWMFDFRSKGVQFHSEGLAPLAQHIFLMRHYNLFWFGLGVIFLLKWRAALRPPARFFLIPSVLSAGAILYVFLFTPNIAWLMNGTTINRTVLIAVPLLTVSAGLLFVEETK